MSLKLSKTAVRELTRLYRGVMVAALVATVIGATGANAATNVVTGGTYDSTAGTITGGTVTDLDAYAKTAANNTFSGNNNFSGNNTFTGTTETHDLTLTSGDLTVHTGDLTVTAGDITATAGDLKLSNGDIITQAITTDVAHSQINLGSTGYTTTVTGDTVLNDNLSVAGKTTLNDNVTIGSGKTLTFDGSELTNVNNTGAAYGTTDDSKTLATMLSIKKQAQNAEYATTGANITASTTLATAINTLDNDIGAVSDLAVNGYTPSSPDTKTVVGAINALDANMEAVLGGVYKSDGTYDNTALAGTTTNLKKGFADSQTSLTAALQNYASNVATATGLTYAADGSNATTYAARTTTGNYEAIATGTSLREAIEKLDNNIGNAITTTKGNVVATNTINANLSALDTAIGNLAVTNSKVAGTDVSTKIANIADDIGGYNASGEFVGKVTKATTADYTDFTKATVMEAIGQVAGNIGGATSATYGNISATKTVNGNLDALDAAIGNRQYANAKYVTPGDNLTKAIGDLDYGLDKLEDRVDKYHEETKAGFASLAALSALVPNARSSGNTQISVGTGYHRGETGFALGAFHYLNDNVLLNLGGAYAGDASATFRGGVTFGF